MKEKRTEEEINETKLALWEDKENGKSLVGCGRKKREDTRFLCERQER